MKRLPRRICLLGGLLRILYYRRVDILGTPCRDRPTLYLLSHRNGAIDGIVYQKALGDTPSLISIQLLRGPLRLLFDGIPVVRDKDRARYRIKADTVAAPVAAAIAQLRAGGSLALYPEGTSAWEFRPLPYHNGMAVIAAKLLAAGVDFVVQPAAAYYSKPDGFRSRVSLIFGAPFVPQGESVAALQKELAAALDAVSVNCANAAQFNQIQQAAWQAAQRGEDYGVAFIKAQTVANTESPTIAKPPADLSPPPVGEGQGGGSKYAAPATPQTATFTYTTSAQVYVNRFTAPKAIPLAPSRAHPVTPPQPSPVGGGSAPVAESPTIAKLPTDLSPPPVGGGSAPVAESPTIAKPPADLSPPPVGEGQGGGSKPPAPATPQTATFTYTMSAQVYVNRFTAPKAIPLAPSHEPPVTPPQPSPTGGGSAPIAESPTIAKPPTDLSPPPVGGGSAPVAESPTITKPPADLSPPPVGEGQGGGSKPSAPATPQTATFTYTMSAQVYVNRFAPLALALTCPLIVAAACLVGRAADGRNNASFFRILGGLAGALLQIPLWFAALYTAPTAGLLWLAAAVLAWHTYPEPAPVPLPETP